MKKQLVSCALRLTPYANNKKMTRNKRYIQIFLLGAMFLFTGQFVYGAEQAISVQAQVSTEEVTVGESFVLQIKIDGNDSPVKPDMSGLQEFTVEPKGGGQNNRESITIINGKINRVSEHGYVFQYELTPKRAGIVTIPAIEITAGGETLLTQPIPVRVAKPEITDEFKLSIDLSETESYVGQPLILTVKWFVSMNVSEFRFDLPFMEDRRFEWADLPEDLNYNGPDAIAINLPDGNVIARKGHEAMRGLKYTTVTLRRILIPAEPGEFSLGRGTVFSKIITGYKQQRGRQPFDNFFNDVLGRRQAVYKQLVTESNDLHLKVLPLPEADRPENFTGLVGQYSLHSEASPTEVNVGDPITMNIMVTGAVFLDNVILPPLGNQQEIANGFKVPDEMAPGVIDGKVKTFTQTIRAKHPSVEEIPGFELAYFNPATKQYESAKTKAIPLQVNATRVITAKDAEGSAAGVTQSGLTTLDKGIAHNYVGEDIIVNQDVEINSWFNSPAGLALIIFPPGIYLLILVPVYFRRKRLEDKDNQQAKKALPQLSRELANLQKGIHNRELQQTVNGVAEAIRIYFAKRLQLPPGALVYADVAMRLHQYEVDSVLLEELKKILDGFEAYHYGAAAMDGSDPDNFLATINDVSMLLKKIDRIIEKQPAKTL